ncbi:MAG: hypothetical protein IKV17_05050 [Bacteroidaceae bacterium]|nr:hypothetical protein [Bacteroidaceae bacterium]
MNNIYKARYILNILFLAGAVLTLIFYFVASRELFFYTGVVTLSIKMIEFILRFIR